LLNTWRAYKTIDLVPSINSLVKEHGHTNVPKSAGALGEWVIKQRQHQRKLLPGKVPDYSFIISPPQKVWDDSSFVCFKHRVEQRQQMEELGFVFEKRQKQQDAKWQLLFEQAKAYKEEHASFKISTKEQEENESLKVLARWLSYQRSYHRRGDLEQQRVQKLEAIGIDWRMHTAKAETKRAPNTTHEEQWIKNYEKIKQVHEANGHCNLLTTHVDQSLYFWLKRQRSAFHKQQLRQDRKELLDNLGINWDPKGETALQDAWNAQFDRLVAYGKENGTVNLPHRYQPNALGTWVASQKRCVRTLGATGTCSIALILFALFC
jgi:Helicase associated domain